MTIDLKGRPTAPDHFKSRKEEADHSAAHVAPSGKPAGATLTVDWKRYEEYLEDSSLSEAQKREFLQALWYIISTFIDLGFGVEPVQQALAAGVTGTPDHRAHFNEAKAHNPAMESTRKGKR